MDREGILTVVEICCPAAEPILVCARLQTQRFISFPVIALLLSELRFVACGKEDARAPIVGSIPHPWPGGSRNVPFVVDNIEAYAFYIIITKGFAILEL